MPRRNREAINETTNQAHSLIEQTLADPKKAENPEVLDALADAAHQLDRLAGNDSQMAALVERVRRLVAAKR